MRNNAIAEMRKDRKIGHTILYFDEIPSTNTHAKELARKGAAHGTVLLAKRQTAGRGRLGKQFYSPAGCGLYLSVIVRQSIAPEDLLAVTACTAAAVHDALRNFDITAQIKWVNDLFLNGRKICGILTVGGFVGEELDFLVIGIGMNIRHNPNVPEELLPILTDLESETGQCIPEDQLIHAILNALESDLDGLHDRAFLPVYRAQSCTIGHRVWLSEEGCEAAAIDYTQDAGLIVRMDDGTEKIITTGQATVMD